MKIFLQKTVSFSALLMSAIVFSQIGFGTEILEPTSAFDVISITKDSYSSKVTTNSSDAFRLTSDCAVIQDSWANDFETNTDCWTVINGGDANGWKSYPNSEPGGGATSYGIQYGASAHDDYLISPVFTVTDFVSNRLTFDARNSSTSTAEIIDIQVWNSDMSLLLETLAAGVTPGTAFQTYVYDLSAFEGQDICFAFYIATTNQYYIFIDNVVVDSATSLGIDEGNLLSDFSFFPNPVNALLSIKAQAPIQSIIVYNMLGQPVVRLRPNTVNTKIDMSGLQVGTYFVEVSVNNTYKKVRVIKL